MASEYIIRKSSRPIVSGNTARNIDGYAGPSCEAAAIEKGRVYTTLFEALCDAARLEEVNHIGWRIYKVGSSRPLIYFQ